MKEPYHQIIPEASDPVMTLSLGKKTGNIPKGTYTFVECYCTDVCDCRRVLLLVLNEKGKQKAVINFGFDQEGPFAGPYLDTTNAQSPYAPQLLDFFVNHLNSAPSWLEAMYRHYREVRSKVERKPYRGKAFPKPGDLVYHATPPPDLEAEMLESLKTLRTDGRVSSRPQGAMAPAGKAREAARGGGTETPSPKAPLDIAALVKRYADAGLMGPIETLSMLHDEVRRYFIGHEDAGEELASYLPQLCCRSPQDGASINGALRLLFDALNELEDEIDGERPGAKDRMENLQKALAQRVFEENEDFDLAIAVANILQQSKVDILPALRRAATKMMVDGARRTDLREIPGEEIMSGIARSLESMGVTSPFEGADELQQLFVMNEPELQIAIVGEMMKAEQPLLREMSALMLLSPEREVRLGVSHLLAEVDGSSITGETLRRLILSRNWLPDQIRKNADQAITNARRARVDCAALVRPDSLTVYATTIDGSGAQEFHVAVPDGAGFARCAIVVNEETGVAHASVVAVKSKGEVNSFIAQIKKEPRFIESSADHLDLRVCHALADEARRSSSPPHWLVRIAELLGRDRWRPITFDAGRELLSMWEDLESSAAKLLTGSESVAALAESGKWALTGGSLPSWHADDEGAGKLKAVRAGGKVDREAATAEILDTVLEKTRAKWLERLVVTALWLKSSPRPLVPWHRMFHVAQAVADDSVPLRDIPLMRTIAARSVDAAMGPDDHPAES